MEHAALDKVGPGPLSPRSRSRKLPLRFALIGTGGISGAHLAAFIARPDAVQLAAICDQRDEALAAFSARLEAPVPTYTDHRALLSEAQIDAAIVTLPHFLHFPVARDVVEAGIDVLVEKPLTCTLDETRQLRDLAAQRGVTVVAGQMQRFERDVTWLHQWVHDDPQHFGALRTFNLDAWQNVLGYIRNVGRDHWILDGAKAGGGVVISLAVHQLDLVRYLTGCDYTEVMAHGRFDPPFFNGAESAASVLLTMTGGAAGVLHASYTTPRIPYSEAMYLYGEHGSIVRHVEQLGQYRGALRYGLFTGSSMAAWNEQYEGLERVPTAGDAEPVSPFVPQLVEFATALVEQGVPLNHINENFNTMACIEAINESLRSGKPERVAMH